jgi:hypothetical protein
MIIPHRVMAGSEGLVACIQNEWPKNKNRSLFYKYRPLATAGKSFFKSTLHHSFQLLRRFSSLCDSVAKEFLFSL